MSAASKFPPYLVFLVLAIVIAAIFFAGNYGSQPILNLTKDEIGARVPNGTSISLLKAAFGTPSSEGRASDGSLTLTYANRAPGPKGNYDYPISVTFYVKDGVVTTRYYHVK